MADIAAGDVTYTMLTKHINDACFRNFTFTVAFGDGALTYPSGGIPLTKASLGCPNVIKSLKIYSDNAGSGVLYKYDAANNKIRLYNAAASHTHTLFLNNADVADGASARVNAGTNLLGANTGSDISIAGVANTSGSGGIVNSSAAVATEVTAASYAPAATTLYVDVIGW
jgi:hypothetical protein